MRPVLMVLYMVMSMSFFVALRLLPREILARGVLIFGAVVCAAWSLWYAILWLAEPPLSWAVVNQAVHIPTVAFMFTLVHLFVAQYAAAKRADDKE